MKASLQATVHHAVAVQLGIEIGEIADDHRLDLDLDMHALELARVGLRLEYSVADQGAFPFDMLDPSMTVGDLVNVYRFWLTPSDRADEAPDTLRMDLPPTSVREIRREARKEAASGAR